MSRSPASAVVPAALPAALPRSALLAYGALGLPLAMAALPVYVHVPRLYAEAAGMM
jgi:GPH family glycoside/pentoside/hexuronide:cation symporter